MLHLQSWFAVWRWRWWMWCVVIPLLLAASWGTSYATLAERGIQHREIMLKNGGAAVTTKAVLVYPRMIVLPRNVQVAMQYVFYPHLIDRQLRPEYWNPTYNQIVAETGIFAEPPF